MSQEQRSDTWSSPNEFRISERESAYVAELEATDDRIGHEVSTKYGRGSIPKRSIPVRLVRRAVFELKKLVGPPSRRAQRVVLRHLNRRVADRRRIQDGTHFESHNSSFVVIALNSPDVRERVQSSRAEFIVFTREADTLLHSAVEHIGDRVTTSDAPMWFGDSRNHQGIRERRAQFNRLLLRQVDALGPVIVVRSSALDSAEVHDVNPALWPLHLGLTLPEVQIELIPAVLGLGDATITSLNGLEDEATNLVAAEIQLSGITASVAPVSMARRCVSYAITDTPLVSIVIPTRGTTHDGICFVVEAVRSILEKSTYANFEIVIVADEPTPQPVVDEIDALASQIVRWVRWTLPFNFSTKMNLGAACARGEYILFLNDDVEVIAPRWIEGMLSLIGVDEIAYSGALLFFADQTIQHAGHFYAGGAGHIGIDQSLRSNDQTQTVQLDREVSGLTAACSLISAALFHACGGFSRKFPGNYNDVDMCFKLREAGHRMAVAGSARLYHFESKSRNATVLRSELEELHSRWYSEIQADANYRAYEHN